MKTLNEIVSVLVMFCNLLCMFFVGYYGVTATDHAQRWLYLSVMWLMAGEFDRRIGRKYI